MFGLGSTGKNDEMCEAKDRISDRCGGWRRTHNPNRIHSIVLERLKVTIKTINRYDHVAVKRSTETQTYILDTSV